MCADLTASTNTGQYWSYDESKRICSVKKANTEKHILDSFVSGTRACGTPIIGKNILPLMTIRAISSLNAAFQSVQSKTE